MDENNILNNPEVFAEPAEIPEKKELADEPSAEMKEIQEEGEILSVLEESVPELFAERKDAGKEEAPADQAHQVVFLEADKEAVPSEEEEAERSLMETPAPELSAEVKEEISEAKREEESAAREEHLPLREGDGPVYVEQLSLLDDQLPHLEAANAPTARKARAVLEGLLFLVGDEGITAEQAGATLDITPELAAEYFDDLMKYYLEEDRGIEIANYGGTYRFLSKAVVHEYARKLFQVSKQATLSQAALETLAIIAYKQPITRVEIEEIRGVGADMMLRKLMARDLIRESGRSEAAGRPILYEVTEEFMNSFKLMSLKELPELPQFNESEESEDLFN